MARPVPDDILLMAYADGELDAQAAAEVEAALAADPALAARVAMFIESAELMREAMGTPEPVAIPQALERQIRRAVWTTRAKSSMRLALPMAAAIAGFVIGGANISFVTGWLGDGSVAQAQAVLHEVAEYHAVFVRETEHLVEVPASRRDHIEAWLGQRVGYPLHVPDLSARGLTFQGARLLAVAGRPVAQLMYENAKGERVALCVTEMDHAAGTLVHMTQHGFDLYAKGAGGHLFIIAAPAASDVARQLSSDITGLLQRG